MRYFLIPLLLLAALPSVAQNNISTPKESANFTELTLAEQARRVVSQDRLTATLSIQHKAKTAEEVQKFINTKMAAAMAIAKKFDDVKIETQGYYVNEEYEWRENVQKRTGWQGNQNITLDGANAETLLKLAGDLQNSGFAMQGLNYYLSREKQNEYRDVLITEALQTLKKRAESIGKTMGRSKVQFANISFDEAPINYPMVARGMMAMADKTSEAMPAPTADPGEQEVNLTVRAVVHLVE